MAESTLSPVGFERRVVKTFLDDEERYALACIFGDGYGSTPSGLVREIIARGLDARGWPKERRIEAYAAHRLRCMRDGTENQYESE